MNKFVAYINIMILLYNNKQIKGTKQNLTLIKAMACTRPTIDK